VYDLVTDEHFPGTDHPWPAAISEPVGYKVKLNSDPGDDELSDAEIEMLEQIFTRYGSLNRWKLVDIAHGLPEWKHPDGSAIQINYSDILEAENREPAEVKALVGDFRNLLKADSLATVR
jgi:hypothetical protein